MLRRLDALALVAASLAFAAPARAQNAAIGTVSEKNEQNQAAETGKKKNAAEAEKPNGAPARVPWRGTGLFWETETSAQTIGWGQDYLSRDYFQTNTSVSAWLNYYLLDRDDDSLTVTAAPGFAVELSNANGGTETVTRHEPLFQDLPVWLTYHRTLFKKDLWATNLSVWARAIFPTSKYSIDSGTYFTTDPWIWLLQTLPLAGSKSPLLKTVTLGFIGHWAHRFGRATTPTNETLDYPRQTAAGFPFVSDQLAGAPLANDVVTETAYLRFDEEIAKMPLTIFSRFGGSQQMLPNPSDGSNPCAVVVNEGQTCFTPAAIPDQRLTQTFWNFDVDLIFQPLPEAGIWLAYGNITNTLAPDGTRRNPFWSPQALVSATLMIFPDALYERLTGPKRATNALGESNTKKF